MKNTTYFALNILKFLAPKTKPVPMKTIAVGVSLERDYVEKICHPLREAGLIRCVQGCKGGVVLRRESANITVLQVADLFESPASLARGKAGAFVDKKIRATLKDISIFKLPHQRKDSK